MTALELVYKTMIRWPLFWLTKNDAETAHEWGIWALERLQEQERLGRWAERHLIYRDDPKQPVMQTKAFGLMFPNPLGVAAGFDKKAEVFHRGLPLLGFGSVEIGGVTALAQSGNPRPRVLRFPEIKAIWNHMGLNSPGATAIAKAIRLHLFAKPS